MFSASSVHGLPISHRRNDPEHTVVTILDPADAARACKVRTLVNTPFRFY